MAEVLPNPPSINFFFPTWLLVGNIFVLKHYLSINRVLVPNSRAANVNETRNKV